MAKGISRSGDGWVTVDFAISRFPITEDLYREKGYEPPLGQLPVIDDSVQEG